MKVQHILLPILRRPSPDRFCEMLTEKAAAGLLPDPMLSQGFLWLSLVPAQAQAYQYCLDYCQHPNAGYRSDWEASGWTRIGGSSRCHIWQAAPNAMRPVPDTQLKFHFGKLGKSAFGCSIIFFLLVALLGTLSALLFASGVFLRGCISAAAALLILLLCFFLLRIGRVWKRYQKE